MRKKQEGPDVITYKCVKCFRTNVTRDKEPDAGRRCQCGSLMDPVDPRLIIKRVKNDEPTAERASVALTKEQGRQLREHSLTTCKSISYVIQKALKDQGVIK